VTRRYLVIKLSNAQRQTQDVSSSSCKNCRCNESTVGKAKGKGSASLDYKKERRNYRCRKKKAFAAYEGAMGGEEESKRQQINSVQQGFSRAWAAAIWLGTGVLVSLGLFTMFSERRQSPRR
jgi:hypothetical protein